MEIDPIYYRASDANRELREIAADVIQTWFRDLETIEARAATYRPGRRFRACLPDHETLASTGAALAFVSRGVEWFRGGRFMAWSAVLQYDDDTCAAIRARFDARAGELEARLRAIGER